MVRRRRKQFVLERDGWTCFFCGEENPEEMTVDHIKPRSEGGDDSVENLRCCCTQCNSNRMSMSDAEFISRVLPRLLYRNRRQTQGP